MRRKTFFAVLMLYMAVALLLPVLPASKMAADARSRKGIVEALFGMLGPETVSAKSRVNDDSYLASRDEEKMQKSFTLPRVNVSPCQ